MQPSPSTRPAAYATRFPRDGSVAVKARDIFDHRPLWATLHKDSKHLVPKARPFGRYSSAQASHRQILARKTAYDAVNRLQLLSPQLADVSVQRHFGEPRLEHTAAERVDLASPAQVEPGPLEGQVAAANAAEQRAGRHAPPSTAAISTSTRGSVTTRPRNTALALCSSPSFAPWIRARASWPSVAMVRSSAAV